MLIQFVRVFCAGVLLSFMAQSASANLLINPTRVDFGPSDRSAEVTLINTSDTTNTYRVEWVEKKAKAVGGYDDLSEAEAAQFPIASKMLRYSPRQVTLKPNERQTIKLAIRRPQGLQNGEYRSHLMFKALPPSNLEENKLNTPTMEINIVLSFAIPIVVAHGPLQYNVAMNNASISYDPAKKEGSVSVSMSRSGANSVIGNINAYWTPNGGAEVLIAKVADFNFWPEVSSVDAPLSWVGTEFAKSDGKLRIVYEGTKGFRGKVFFEKTINVTGSMIKMAN